MHLLMMRQRKILYVCPIKDPWQWPRNLPPWGKKHLCIRIRVCFLREFLPTTSNKEIRVKRTFFSQDLRLGSYLRPEWSRKIRPRDKGPPSTRGVRLGVYLRLEWSKDNNHKNTTLICLHFLKGLSLNYYTWGPSPILRPVVRMLGCTCTPSFVGSGVQGPCIYQSAY